MTNDKGGTWAYATPGYASSLVPSHLKLMRDLNFAQGGGEDLRTHRDRNVTEVGSVPNVCVRGRRTRLQMWFLNEFIQLSRFFSPTSEKYLSDRILLLKCHCRRVYIH